MTDGVTLEWAQPALGENLTRGPLFDDEAQLEALFRVWEALLEDRSAATAPRYSGLIGWLVRQAYKEMKV